MIPRQNTRYQSPVSKKEAPQKISPVARCAYLLFSGTISALIALVSILLVFVMVAILTSGTVFGITIPEQIPDWGAMILLLIAYVIIVMPLQILHFKFSPHKEYALYGMQSSPKYGDQTLWFALFILLGWYISEHRSEFAVSLQSFPGWWRNFVDTVGPWLYQ